MIYVDKDALQETKNKGKMPKVKLYTKITNLMQRQMPGSFRPPRSTNIIWPS